MKSFLFISLLLFAAIATAQSKSNFSRPPAKPPAPPVAAETNVKVMINNSQVRASRIDLAPGGSTHVAASEFDQVVVSIGRNDFELVGPVNSLPMSMADDEVQVIKGRWPHRVQNKGTDALHLVIVEVKHGIFPERATCGLGGPSCTHSRFAFNDADKYVEGVLFETPSVRLSRVEIDPNAGMPEHGHTGDHVMIALTDELLTNAVVGEDTTRIQAQRGDATWVPGRMVHKLANDTPQKVRFLAVECK